MTKMAVAAFRSTTKREYQVPSEISAAVSEPGHRKTRSYSDSSSRYFSDTASFLDYSSNYQDASSQRDSDQDSLCPDESRSLNRHLSSDSESESKSIIDRFRQSESRSQSSSSTIPRFLQSTASTRGRQRQIEPHGRSESKGPGGRHKRSESQEPGFGRQGRSTTRNDLQGLTSDNFSGRQSRRSESQEPVVGRYRRSESQEPVVGRHRRSESQEPVVGCHRRSESQEPVVGRHRRSESQEPRRRRSESKEPVHGRHRRSESQGPVRGGPQRFGIPRDYYVSHFPGNACSDEQAEERTIRAVHAQLKETFRLDPPTGDVDAANLYDVMRAEVRKAVADLKTEIEQSLEKDWVSLAKSAKGTSDGVPDIRKQCAERLEQSEIRMQQLRSQLAEEEQTRIELAKLVPSVWMPEQQSRTRRDVEERESISKALDKDAQRFFEEFASISASETEESPDNEPSIPATGSLTPQVEYALPGKELASQNEDIRCKTGHVAVNINGLVVGEELPDKRTSRSFTQQVDAPRKELDEVIPRRKTGLLAVKPVGMVMTQESSDEQPSKPAMGSFTQQVEYVQKSLPGKECANSTEGIPCWKTGLVAVNTDGVVMPWLDWEADSNDTMTSSGFSRSCPGNVAHDFLERKLLLSTIPRLSDSENMCESGELFLQRMRFKERIEAGRIHLCRCEF